MVCETLQSITHRFSPERDDESTFRVNYQGEVDASVDPGIAIAQLLDPDPLKPVFLTGLRLPILAELGFRCPSDLCTVAEPMEESNVQINLTPKFSFVDLHIDYGADGVSALVGDCRKIWLLYPPSRNNLVAMRTVDGQRGKLARIMHRLEGGIMVETTAAQSLYIPAGCIHATFTLQGGFLVARDFTTSISIGAISAYIASGLEGMLTPQAREACWDWFSRCLDVSLAHGQFDRAIRAWMDAEPRLAIWASLHRHWRTAMRRIWDLHVQEIPEQCPCGTQGDAVLQDHLYSTHLKCLLPPSRMRRQKRSDAAY
ncbi:uncharacterized protein LDX57_008676 [Aspergillus melleus]|uniref:uncharacterized protein n=1 Tax=Aspergillus melleus TaxID=138277 RepID=UPI001E8E89D8|nr:uncharacterized protein LDX57_008676 [Aspergillus melleus]KAH8431015.1 hypothetical protein LDX57_008676 [Aspergillus melleus]